MWLNISHLTIPDNFNNITDFFIPVDDPSSGVVYPDAIKIKDMPEIFDLIEFVLSEAKKKNKLDFSLELTHENMRVIFRGHYINSIEGKVFILRRLPSYIPNIEDLGIPSNILELITSNRLNSGGLIILTGETGQGKSTTAAAAIAYRLKTFGSYCLTIEDPVELPLQGFYDSENGKRGVCFQTAIDGDGLEEAIKGALRCYPTVNNSILFLGEIRDSLTASEVLKIATNGHLVITTMHASDLLTATKRFINLASSYKNNNESETKSMFASVFRLLLHQRLITVSSARKRLDIHALFSSGSTSAVANKLRGGNVDMLSTEIQNQNMLLKRGASILNA